MKLNLVRNFEKEEDFNFKSIGLRWLESNPSTKVIKMILGFCEMMTPILENNDWQIKIFVI